MHEGLKEVTGGSEGMGWRARGWEWVGCRRAEEAMVVERREYWEIEPQSGQLKLIVDGAHHLSRSEAG